MKTKSKQKSAVLIYSGGLDSTVLLASLLQRGYKVRALSINYGQRHSHELQRAGEICKNLRVEHFVANMAGLTPLLAGSSQTDPSVKVPHGHYAAKNMALTVVANRNMLMLAMAGAWAISTKSNAVAYAAHAGDHAIYPDCRETFVAPLADALWNADNHHVSIIRPFINLTKKDIVKLGKEMDIENLMAFSYSCYEGNPLVHCGLCGTCQERRAAFRDAGVPDQTVYSIAGLKKLPTNKIKS